MVRLNNPINGKIIMEGPFFQGKRLNQTRRNGEKGLVGGQFVPDLLKNIPACRKRKRRPYRFSPMNKKVFDLDNGFTGKKVSQKDRRPVFTKKGR
jgi:hypothetical protein